MTARRISILLRHGDYHQLEDTPSAHQPFPLNTRGEEQAAAAGGLIESMLRENGWRLHPVVHCSTLLRAWQTAQAVIDVMPACESWVQTDLLTERGVGSAANLSRSQIEEIVREDPRCEELPQGWKLDSHLRLPFVGAESLMEAGDRVASYISSTFDQLNAPADEDLAVLFVGHGGSFRHAAHHLGALEFAKVGKLSMYHARPVALARQNDGSWIQVAGEWKVRSDSASPPD